jgi:pilus assembly protein CpaB
MRFGGLIIAILLAAVAAFMVLSIGNTPPPPVAQAPAPPPEEIKTRNIFVATRPIPAGTLVTDDMVEIQPWPEHLMVKGFVTADDERVSGMVARANFEAQEPLIMAKLVNRSDPNFIAGALPKGLRMITIQTNETDGLAGLVFPGDRVDILLTHEVKATRWVDGAGGGAGRRAEEREITQNLTETLLTNVRVLAVDQRSEGGLDAEGNITIPRTVSLMVAPADAQRLRLAEQVGELTLALRSLNDKDAVDPLTITGIDDISQYRTGNRPMLTRGVMVVRGIVAEESTGLEGSLDLPAQLASSASNSPF